MGHNSGNVSLKKGAPKVERGKERNGWGSDAVERWQRLKRRIVKVEKELDEATKRELMKKVWRVFEQIYGRSQKAGAPIKSGSKEVEEKREERKQKEAV